MGFRRGTRRNRLYATGENHRRWLEGERGAKRCQYCNSEFSKHKTESIRTFWRRKFCCKICADKGGLRYSGEKHPNYRETARTRNRGGSTHRWINAVISRDKATCQNCGARDVELHAHHIKSFKDFPELRFDVANGLTLCFRCHWNLHSAQNEKAVNSVDTRTGDAEGNTEPSYERKFIEGVTTRGRAYRRWVGKCEWCKTDISKRWSDTKGREALFCSGSCRSKWIRKKVGQIPKPKAVTSSKSAATER